MVAIEGRFFQVGFLGSRRYANSRIHRTREHLTAMQRKEILVSEKIDEILGYVLRDVTSSGLETPRIEPVDWYNDPQVSSAMIYSVRDSTGRGVSVQNDLSLDRQLVAVADQIQEWVIEEVGTTHSNWPQCPLHPNNHPLAARIVDDRGVWACPASNTPVARIGELGPA